MPEQDYSKTLNLPKTEFSMRADLPKKEPGGPGPAGFL